MISILIPSYQRPEILAASLIDLRHQTLFTNYKVDILLGLEKNDPTLNIYRHYVSQVNSLYRSIYDENINVNVITGNFNGIVAAKIELVNNSCHPYLFFLDDDLFLEPEYIEALYKDMQADKSVSACSGFLVTYIPAISHTQPSDQINEPPEQDTLQTLNLEKDASEWRLVFGKKEQVMDWSFIRNRITSDKRYKMDYFVNSFMCRKSSYVEVNGFNTHLNSKTSAHEEVDITYRLGKLDSMHLQFNPLVRGWHITVGEGGIYKGNNYQESKQILEKEYNDALEPFIDSIKNVRFKG